MNVALTIALGVLSLAPAIPSNAAHDAIEESAAKPQGDEPLTRDRITFCQRDLTKASANNTEAIEKCEELAAALQSAELSLVNSENDANLILAKCRKIAAKLNSPSELEKFSVLFEQLGGVNGYLDGKGAPSAKAEEITPDAIMSNDCEEKSVISERLPEAASAQYKELARQLISLKKRLSEARRINTTTAQDFDKAVSNLSLWHGETEGVSSSSASLRKRVVRTSKSRLQLSREDCSLPVKIDAAGANQVAFLAPNSCRKFLVQQARPAVGWASEKRFGPPSTFDLSQSLTAGSSSGNAKLEISNTISRFNLSFERDPISDSFSRRPKNLTFRVAAEAKLEDGIASFIQNNSADRNFFSLERLNTTAQLSGALGINFFPRQSAKEFEALAGKLREEIEQACQKSIREKTTKVVTDCLEPSLTVWLLELKDKKYARKTLVEKYDQLLWNSDAEYPEFGFGGRFSVGLRNRSFHNFTDEEGQFDASLVDTGAFFSDPKTSNQFGEISNRPSYNLGAYGYYHVYGDDLGWGEGLTTIVTATLQNDLPKLRDKEIEICQSDLGAISNDGVFERSDLCEKTLPFKPEFETTIIPSIEFRFGLPEVTWTSKLGAALKASAEIGKATGDTLRFEAPLYLSAKKDVLIGGVGVAHEIHFVPGKANTSATTFYIFVGRKFSLDGSK
jgi:hypothetical protein